MSDADQKDGEPVETAGGQGEDQGVPGLGALLKAEREKKGLSHQQVSEMTRLRRHMIEALEAEAWDLLPPPVFVRGFVRSYIKALGLDEKKFLDLYDEMAPIEARTPKLIPRSPKKKRGHIFLFIILFFILAGILYAWLGSRPAREAPPSEEGRPVTLPEKEAQVPPPEMKEPGPATNVGEPAVEGVAPVATP
ncbi:MAG: helix-turn-helix transcriptional regulator, partial [Pseudomonadota bacterium]